MRLIKEPACNAVAVYFGGQYFMFHYIAAKKHQSIALRFDVDHLIAIVYAQKTFILRLPIVVEIKHKRNHAVISFFKLIEMSGIKRTRRVGSKVELKAFKTK